MSTIAEGDYAVLDENGTKKAVNLVRKNGQVKVGKSFVSTASLVGAPWGSVYQLAPDGRTLERITQMESALPPAPAEVDKDNRELVDDAQHQTLTADQIEEMKRQGKDGRAIIDALCSSSTTFDTKTQFAQAKYKKRKADKYLVKLTLRRPTARTLCEVFFDKATARMYNLRPDSLAILLSLSNAAAYGKVLVIESCQGVVTAAVAERMGGYGTLCAAGTGSAAAPLDALRFLNLKPEQLQAVCTASLAGLKAAKAAGAQQGSEPSTDAPAHDERTAADGHAGTSTAAGAAVPTDGDPSSSSQQQNGQQQLQQQQQHTRHSYIASQQQLRQLVHPGFSSCILANPKMHTMSLLEEVLPLLAPSATFVVFSPWQQPLAEAMHQLTKSKRALMLQLQESWMRPYQVLPGRTHPHMATTGTGGYLLSGIVAATTEQEKIQLAPQPPQQPAVLASSSGKQAAAVQQTKAAETATAQPVAPAVARASSNGQTGTSQQQQLPQATAAAGPIAEQEGEPPAKRPCINALLADSYDALS